MAPITGNAASNATPIAAASVPDLNLFLKTANALSLPLKLDVSSVSRASGRTPKASERVAVPSCLIKNSVKAPVIVVVPASLALLEKLVFPLNKVLPSLESPKFTIAFIYLLVGTVTAALPKLATLCAFDTPKIRGPPIPKKLLIPSNILPDVLVGSSAIRFLIVLAFFVTFSK